MVPNRSLYQRGFGRQKPPPGSRADGSHPLARSLNNAWLFNERGGTQVFDVTGRSKGTYNPGTGAMGWSPGPLGMTPDMGGGLNGQYVSLPLFTSLRNAMSVCVWFVPQAASQVARVLFSGSSGNNGWGFYQNNGSGAAGSKLTVLLDGVSFDATASTATLSAGTPVFATATVTSGNVWTLYINGVKDSSATVTGIAPTLRAGIGADGNGFENFNGDVAFAAFWARTLKADEVLQLYQEPYGWVAQPAPRRMFFGPAAAGGFTQPPIGAFAAGANRLLTGGPVGPLCEETPLTPLVEKSVKRKRRKKEVVYC